jgi:hypothetical protein
MDEHDVKWQIWGSLNDTWDETRKQLGQWMEQDVRDNYGAADPAKYQALLDQVNRVLAEARGISLMLDIRPER